MTFEKKRQEGNWSIVTINSVPFHFLYTGITCQIFHDDRNIPVLIDMFNSVAKGPVTVGSDIFNTCNDSLSTLLVAGDDGAVITFLTSSV